MTSDKQPNWLDKGTTIASDWYATLEQRERYLFIGMSAFLLSMLLYFFAQFLVVTANRRIDISNRLDADIATLPTELDRFIKLQQRQTRTEEYFKSIVADDANVEGYLETLIKDKTGITNIREFTIEQQAPSSFAGTYTRVPRRVRFSITQFNSLIDFLTEVVKGKQPLLLSTLKLERDRRGDRIAVELIIDSIQRV
jgi:hypothetical protein